MVATEQQRIGGGNMTGKLYRQTQYKAKRREKYERERAVKNLRESNGSRHQKQRLLAEVRKSEVIDYGCYHTA